MANMQPEKQARILVFSTLFPHPGQPNAGLFVRERMFRVGKKLPVIVVAPVPWFPLQGLIRIFKPNYRPPAPYREVQEGIEVYHPRFLAFPALFRSMDGWFMAVGSFFTLHKLKRQFRFNLIDAHFAYPDGYAATILGKWFKMPVTITLRGTEVPISKTNRSKKMMIALEHATRIFSVAKSLKNYVVSLGAKKEKILVVGNGVDVNKFYPVEKYKARTHLKLPIEAPILITVGGLVERKGFHRVIECIPELRKTHPNLQYLIIGGSSGEGDWRDRLEQQVNDLNLSDCVHFLGVLSPGKLKVPLSAADIFVLSTRNEGWANVFLEAMACGLPVITTDVGGNAEVVSHDELGTIVPFASHEMLVSALKNAMMKKWDKDAIRHYAEENSWDSRVDVLVSEFDRLVDSKHTVKK